MGTLPCLASLHTSFLVAFGNPFPLPPCPRYDPYSKVFSEESYDHPLMRRTRREAVERARAATVWGVVLGTLGRQGNTRVLDLLREKIRASGEELPVLKKINNLKKKEFVLKFNNFFFCLPDPEWQTCFCQRFVLALV